MHVEPYASDAHVDGGTPAPATSAVSPLRARPRHARVEVIRITDLDRPLYRIFPLWFFEHALRVSGGCLVLVPPSAWEDPHEDFCAKIMMSAPDPSQKALASYLWPAYAQCWSFEGESDSLLRAYSRVTKDPIVRRNVEPKFEGVQVRTTPRKLVGALEAFVKKRNDAALKFYLGAVDYEPNFHQAVVAELGSVLNKDSRPGRVVIQGLRLGGGHDSEASFLVERGGMGPG